MSNSVTNERVAAIQDSYKQLSKEIYRQMKAKFVTDGATQVASYNDGAAIVTNYGSSQS
jgi:hypothetical protein